MNERPTWWRRECKYVLRTSAKLVYLLRPSLSAAVRRFATGIPRERKSRTLSCYRQGIVHSFIAKYFFSGSVVCVWETRVSIISRAEVEGAEKRDEPTLRNSLPSRDHRRIMQGETAGRDSRVPPERNVPARVSADDRGDGETRAGVRFGVFHSSSSAAALYCLTAAPAACQSHSAAIAPCRINTAFTLGVLLLKSRLMRCLRISRLLCWC